MKVRIQKWIAQSGLMSRRKAEEAIAAGKVAVNGYVIREMGHLIDPLFDQVLVDGQVISQKTQKQTYIFHKPRGVVTTKSDPEGRPTVMDYFPDDPGLNPVGRLDFDSEGLLLLTHDGDLLLRLTHPRYEVPKVYEVQTEGPINPARLAELTREIGLSDGPGKFNDCEATGKNSFRVTVSEGRNRFVRRMFAAIGLTVVCLKRVQMGEFELGGLLPGEKRLIP